MILSWSHFKRFHSDHRNLLTFICIHGRNWKNFKNSRDWLKIINLQFREILHISRLKNRLFGPPCMVKSTSIKKYTDSIFWKLAILMKHLTRQNYQVIQGGLQKNMVYLVVPDLPLDWWRLLWTAPKFNVHPCSQSTNQDILRKISKIE